jgi:hypothetical protein
MSASVFFTVFVPPPPQPTTHRNRNRNRNRAASSNLQMANLYITNLQRQIEGEAQCVFGFFLFTRCPMFGGGGGGGGGWMGAGDDARRCSRLRSAWDTHACSEVRLWLTDCE